MNLQLCITQSKTGGEKFKSWSKRLWKLLNHYSTTCPFKARKRRQSYENGLEWNHKWLRMVIIWMANTCKFQFKRFLKPKTKFKNSTTHIKSLLKSFLKIRDLFFVKAYSEYKGQLISKCPYGVFKSLKKHRNFCKDFCL